MLLRGRDGSELELRLVDYEFPAALVDPWDSNWLLVSVRVVSPQGAWEVVDPCLTTWEAERLARWLTVAAVGAAGPRMAFAEPNLEMTVEAADPREPSQVRVSARLDLESRPPWQARAGAGGGLAVDLDLTRRDLADAAMSLRDELSRFPQRGPDPTL